MLIEPGTVIGNDFRIERFLKSGGMGDVYVARQLSTDKQRALKLMKSELTRDPRTQERFRQEARVGAQINSPYVVEVISAGIDELSGRPWLAMELLNGDDLRTFVERRGLPPPALVARIFEQLGRALGKAHDAQIVHRDLKPENIFLVDPVEPNGLPTVKVLDFGIAKIIADYKSQSAGTVQIGTPLWMAPEQTDSSQPITPAVDIWPLGLIGFWLLTGHHYWVAAERQPISVQAIMRELVVDEIVPASVRAAQSQRAVPAGFDAWFARCVEREPTRRFVSAQQAGEALASVLHGAAGSSAPQPPYATPRPDPFRTPGPAVRTTPPPQRAYAQMFAAALVGLGALGGIGWGAMRLSLQREKGRCEDAGTPARQRGIACMNACERGATRTCLVAGSLTRDNGEAIRAYRLACNDNEIEGCSHLAEAVLGSNPPDNGLALQLYLQTCDQKVHRDCLSAGRLLLEMKPRDRRQADKDAARARELFDLACNGGEGGGCGALAQALKDGVGGPRDPHKAATLFQKGCDSKVSDASSCLQLGRIFEEGQEPYKKAEQRARHYYAMACERDLASGCTLQGELLRTGRGGDKDEAQAGQLYRKACERAEPDLLGCVRLASYQLDGSGAVARDTGAAEKQLARHCDGDSFGPACHELGLAYQRGRGVAADPGKAQSYLKKACALKVAEACELPPPPPPPPPKPVCPSPDTLASRCDEKLDGEACNQLGALYERGRCGVAKKLCTAHRYYKVGCDFTSNKNACDNHRRFDTQYQGQCPG